MSNDELTEEQRLLIEAKRKKALESRNHGQVAVGFRQTISKQLPVMPLKESNRTSSSILFRSTSTPCATPKLGPRPPPPNVSVPKSASNPPITSFNGRPNAKKPNATAFKNTTPGFTVTSVPVTCTLSSRTTFDVHAPYHPGLSQVYKSLPTRQYNSSIRNWSFGLSDYNEFVRQLKSIPEIVLDGLPFAVLKTFKSAFSSCTPAVCPTPSHNVNLVDHISQDLVNSLLPFQREGVSLALAKSGRVLLADDMGLGKTVQSLALAAAYRSDWPVLIVAPSSVRFAWRDQCLRWLGVPLCLSSADILVVTTGSDLANIQYLTKLITIISYDLMSRHVEQLSCCRFGVVIMDESHLLKNNKAARTKAALPLLKAAKRALLLSGTPAVSRPAELYPQISAIAPNLFRGGFHEYGLRYCAAKECPWGWDYTGCSNMTELQLILEESIMIRRMKSDVLDQLPPKRRELVVLDPSLIKAGRLKRHAKMMASTTVTDEAKRAAMLQYFHETASVKLPALQQYLSDLIETGRKVILYAHHTEVLDALSSLLMEKSVDFIRIDGRTNSEQRSVVCKKFQREPTCMMALLSITAAGTGLNLTAASLVVFAELFWNPGALVQAEDRAYRIGQQDSVLVRYLLAEGTADDYLWSLIEKKLDVLGRAGLNRESFRTADTTRLGNNPIAIQPSILNYFESELLADDNGDAIIAGIEEPSVTDSSPVFELEPKRSKIDVPRKQTKVTNLFEQPSGEPTPAPDIFQCSGRVLVSDTPEASPEKSAPTTGFLQDKELDSHTSLLLDSLRDESTLTMNDDETVLLEAAVAAEVAWLTEGIASETGTDEFG